MHMNKKPQLCLYLIEVARFLISMKLFQQKKTANTRILKQLPVIRKNPIALSPRNPTEYDFPDRNDVKWYTWAIKQFKMV